VCELGRGNYSSVYTDEMVFNITTLHVSGSECVQNFRWNKENGNARVIVNLNLPSKVHYHEYLADSSGTFIFSQYSTTSSGQSGRAISYCTNVTKFEFACWFRESKLGFGLSCILWCRVVSTDCLTEDRYFCMQHWLRWYIASTQRYSPALNYTCTRDKEHSPNDSELF